VCLRQALPRTLQRVGSRRAIGDALQQPDELGQREGPFDPGASVDDRGAYVHPLEAEHEVERLEVELSKVSGAMGRHVHAERLGHLDRLGKGGYRPELENP
jgi:hypothetical protein